MVADGLWGIDFVHDPRCASGNVLGMVELQEIGILWDVVISISGELRTESVGREGDYAITIVYDPVVIVDQRN